MTLSPATLASLPDAEARLLTTLADRLRDREVAQVRLDRETELVGQAINAALTGGVKPKVIAELMDIPTGRVHRLRSRVVAA